MDDGGSIEEEDLLVDEVEAEVDVDDSLDRAGCTSISSLIRRLRLRDMTGVGFVFMDASAAAAALRLGVEEEEVVGFRDSIGSFEVGFVDLVCRVGGDRSRDILLVLLFCFMALQ